jgi:hypothetical protein
MLTDFERQTIVDGEQLRLLALGYWIWGGFMALYALFIVGYFGLLGSVFLMIPNGSGDAPPAFLGWIFIGAGVAVLVLVGALAALEIATGFWIHRRQHRVGSLVVAALLCPSIPFGTMVGVSTFVVLSRPTVKALFGPSSAGPNGWEAPRVDTQVPTGTGLGAGSVT